MTALRHFVIAVVVIALFVPIPIAAAAVATDVRECALAALASAEGAASPGWLLTFHRLPAGVEAGDSYRAARVHTVIEELRFVSVDAEHDELFLTLACADPRVRSIEPNRVVHVS